MTAVGPMTETEVREGISRLGKREGNIFLRRWLMKQLMHVTQANANMSAVSHSEGRRSLALELLDMMDFESPDARPDDSHTPVERPRRTSGSVSSLGRRVPIEPEFGYGPRSKSRSRDEA
jgi:hypothetical protein